MDSLSENQQLSDYNGSEIPGLQREIEISETIQMEKDPDEDEDGKKTYTKLLNALQNILENQTDIEELKILYQMKHFKFFILYL